MREDNEVTWKYTEEPNAMESEKSFDLQIPSVLGFEKVVVDFAASVGKILHLPAERIEDLKTAVAEACTNAIEHGNKMKPSARVSVSFTIEESKLQVDVRDEGMGIGQSTPPSLEHTISGKKDRPRGWGIFLIKNLIDEVEFETRPGRWNMVRMVVRLQE
jgi:serine/threonine-protein kinase RsbW